MPGLFKVPKFYECLIFTKSFSRDRITRERLLIYGLKFHDLVTSVKVMEFMYYLKNRLYGIQ